MVLVEVIDGALGAITAASLRPAGADHRRAAAARLGAAAARGQRPASRTRRVASAAAVVAPSAVGIHTRFAEVAAKTPDNLAISWAGGTLTYRELDIVANALAARLADRGVRSETPVAIMLSRGPAVRRRDARGAQSRRHVCADGAGDCPRNGWSRFCVKRGASIVVDDDLLAARGDADADFRPVEVPPEQAAYVVFTSGTTGEPKGVIGTHAAVGGLRRRSPGHRVAAGGRPAGSAAAHRARVVVRVRRRVAAVGRAARTATVCTSSTSAPRPTPRRWSRRSPSTAST